MKNVLATRIADQVNLGGFEPPSEAWKVETGSAAEAKASTLSNLELFISNLLGIITVLASLFFIVYFVSAAFKWSTAGGDSGKIEKAREQMIQGALGLILMIASYSIIGLLGRIIGLDILNPAQMIDQLIP